MFRYIICIFTLFVFLHPELFAQDSTYRGKEFWAGYGLHQSMETGGTNQQELVFYLSTRQDPAVVTITIDSCAAPWSRTYNIPANTVIVSDLMPKSGASDARLYSAAPSFGGSLSSGIIRRKGIHIQSDVPIAVYSHTYSTASSGASLLLPIQTWGYTYSCLNSKQQYASNCYSWAYVIAKEDNTLIEIKPDVPTFATNITGLQQGVASLITLHKGQIFQFLGENNNTPTGYELTGTSIRSLSAGKPIAVFSGSSRTQNPATCGTNGGDHDMVQLFPLHIWGKKYLTAPLSVNNATSLGTSMFKILVKDTQTVVKRNGVVLTGLLNSSYYIYESNTADYIEASKPVMVAQFMISGGCLGESIGDPDMYYLSPIDAGVKYVNCVRSSKNAITINYVTLIIPTNGISSLLIDGNAAFDHSFTHPALPGYSVVIKSWPSSISQFTIQSDSAFTGVGYGLGSVESYGYNIGAAFLPNNGMDPMVPLRWTGTLNTDWFAPGNWSTSKIPTEDDYVSIPPGTPYSPVVPAGREAICKSITVENGATIDIGNNANLHIIGK